jgi:hypothetical protein
VKVYFRGGKVKKAIAMTIKAPGSTGDNIATNWDKRLALVGVKTVGGRYKRQKRWFILINAKVRSFILTGNWSTMKAQDPSFVEDTSGNPNRDPYSLFFDKETNRLELWNGP